MRMRFALSTVILLALAHAAAAQCRIEGVVHAEGGGPVAGAVVQLDTLERHTKSAKALTVTTDAEGRFAFDNVTPGRRVRISVTQLGKVPHAESPGEPAGNYLYNGR